MSPDVQLYFANWTLVTQIVGSAAAVCSVAVAALFGFLTLRATNSAQKAGVEARVATADAADANERANIAATTDYSGSGTLSGTGTLSAAATTGPPPRTASWSVAQTSIEEWSLTNTGPVTAYRVELSGLTNRDRSRIHARWNPIDSHTIEQGKGVGFQFAQRLGLTGPGVLVVEWTDSPDDIEPHTTRIAINP